MKSAFLILFILALSKVVCGQNIIYGMVTDTNSEPLFGVNIYIKGAYDGASTNEKGMFKFRTDVSGIKTLIASCIGFKKHEQEIDLSSDSVEIKIILEEEINKIDGITISAGAFEAGDKKKSVILRTFDIVTTAGATADITGVMNTLPGTQTVGEEGRLFVRGGSSHEVKSFINGLLIAEPYGLTPQHIPSRFRFNPFLFKGVFFSTGGYSAEYGQALSSVLQLETYDLPARSQTDISLMTVGTDISQTIRKNNTSLYGQVQYTDLSAYYMLVPQKDDWERAPYSFNTTLHFKQKVGQHGKIQAYTNYDRSNMVVNQPFPGDIYQQTQFDITTHNLYTNIAVSNSIGESLSYRGGIAYTNNLNHVLTDVGDLDTKVNSIHAKLVLEHDLSENVLFKYGAEWIYDEYQELTFDRDENQTSYFNLKNHLISPFAEASVYFSNKLMARFGTRYEYNQLISSHDLAPRVSLAYKLNKNNQFSMAFGRFSQLPIREYLKWDSELQPEKASHYILNYQYTKEGRIFRSEVYFKKYDQLVTQQSDVEQYHEYENGGYGEAKGIEIFWRDSRTFESIDYWISYSYLDTKRKYDIFPDLVMPYYASNQNITIVYKHFITPIKSQIGWTYSFASGRPYTDPNTGEYNSRYTGAYHDLSLNYSYLVKPNIIIHAAVSNVFGFKNIFGYQYSSKPNENGIYESIPIEPQAKRFIFLGFFITIAKDKNANQLNNL